MTCKDLSETGKIRDGIERFLVFAELSKNKIKDKMRQKIEARARLRAILEDQR